jgi:hypothetical protein
LAVSAPAGGPQCSFAAVQLGTGPLDGFAGLLDSRRKYALNMATIGIWNKRQRFMDEEFLFWDNQSFYAQIGL